jgi:hypothetical protein
MPESTLVSGGAGFNGEQRAGVSATIESAAATGT